MSTVDVRDHSMVVADGRVVAWTECGPVDGVPVLRMPGTPGCRWTLRADRSPWTERSLRVITTERPGFGASSRLAGRGFSEHASDVAKILDHLDVARSGSTARAAPPRTFWRSLPCIRSGYALSPSWPAPLR